VRKGRRRVRQVTTKVTFRRHEREPRLGWRERSGDDSEVGELLGGNGVTTQSMWITSRRSNVFFRCNAWAYSC
jgi:hypothetical protein